MYTTANRVLPGGLSYSMLLPLHGFNHRSRSEWRHKTRLLMNECQISCSTKEPPSNGPWSSQRSIYAIVEFTTTPVSLWRERKTDEEMRASKSDLWSVFILCCNTSIGNFNAIQCWNILSNAIIIYAVLYEVIPYTLLQCFIPIYRPKYITYRPIYYTYT